MFCRNHVNSEKNVRIRCSECHVFVSREWMRICRSCESHLLVVVICANCALEDHRTHYLEKIPLNFHIAQRRSFNWKKRLGALLRFKLKKAFVSDMSYEDSTKTLKTSVTTPVKSPISANANKEHIPCYQNVNNSSQTTLLINYAEII